MKKELIFLGPPACGKGTQTNKLSEYLNLPHVDTGSLLRAEIKSGSEEGLIAKQFIDKGQLVPVDLVGKIISKKLASKECENGYVLDGYPRSMEQALVLEEVNKSIDNGNKAVFKAIYFEIDTDMLIDRIIHRQSCPKCGEIYNKKYKPAKIDNTCDKCNVELVTRADDNEDVAKARFETYFRETAPLIEFYKNKGNLFTIDANGSIEEVWKRLLNAVNS